MLIKALPLLQAELKPFSWVEITSNRSLSELSLLLIKLRNIEEIQISILTDVVCLKSPLTVEEGAGGYFTILLSNEYGSAEEVEIAWQTAA